MIKLIYNIKLKWSRISIHPNKTPSQLRLNRRNVWADPRKNLTPNALKSLSRREKKRIKSTKKRSRRVRFQRRLQRITRRTGRWKSQPQSMNKNTLSCSKHKPKKSVKKPSSKKWKSLGMCKRNSSLPNKNTMG